MNIAQATAQPKFHHQWYPDASRSWNQALVKIQPRYLNQWDINCHKEIESGVNRNLLVLTATYYSALLTPAGLAVEQ